ncbi:MAG TPA: bifunctional lysylphosphatidylglycerol flippase/synthetase MprF [Steroidobacter sp.]|uniref:bifunctional lysylphosphatidylglycerol flippase/synthetase MprF n=1 Tax=Steroidobacter sp. TaxID=1978227 RepID=UPI002ED91EDD
MAEAEGGGWARWRIWLIAAGAALISLLLYDAFRVLLAEVHASEVMRQMAAEPPQNLLLTLLATVVSYVVLTGYDLSAMKYAEVKIRRSTVLLTSFIAYALGNTVGLGVLTGGAVRMRLYTAAGVETNKVAQVIAFNASAFTFGTAAFGAVGLLWGAEGVAELAHMPAWLLRVVAAAVLCAVLGFVALSVRCREVLIAWRWKLRLPPAKLAVQQLVISALDLLASAAALWFLLPSGAVDPAAFIAWYSIALVLGILSHVPGGLGVFEAIILLACADRAPVAQVLSALVLYRVIYYLLPLVLAAVLLAAYEMRSGIAAPIGRAAVRLSPMLLATMTFIAGGWLLVSGVTPASAGATDLLALHVPLPLVEASHFLGSVTGFAMIVIARGLLHRLDAAWWGAFVLAIVAAILAMPKGFALIQACYLLLLAALLYMSRAQFDRRSALFSTPLRGVWLISVVWMVVATAFLLLFVYRRVDFSSELWWQFEFDANAPRSLRAMMGVVVTGFGVALWQLLRPSPGAPSLPTESELERASNILRSEPSAEANLVLMGDKHLLFSAQGDAFIMYGRQGRSWISLFDPVGRPAQWQELIWRFIELATDHGGRATFYQVRGDSLPLYLDAGLRAFKLGEYAYVQLQEFTTKGTKRSHLRQALNRGERDGLEFSIVQPVEVQALLPELRAVSDAWLEEHDTREKGFSLGAFDPAYLTRQPFALVRQQGTLVAFANLLCTHLKSEASIDLMRQLPLAPPGTMDFMFTKLMLHFQAEGYQRFGLGMAPMSGMANHELAPRWHRFGRLLFDHGETFYSFRGLRSFKDKFDPVWEPRYLVTGGGLSPLITLADVAALISGGLRGILAK